MTFSAGNNLSASELNNIISADDRAHLAALTSLGYVGWNIQTSEIAATTTEVCHSSLMVTATLVAGRRYRATFSGCEKGTVVTDSSHVRMRYAAGSTVDASGTAFRNGGSNIQVANTLQPLSLTGIFTAPASGQYTVGVSTVRYGGTGTVYLTFVAGVLDAELLLEGM